VDRPSVHSGIRRPKVLKLKINGNPHPSQRTYFPTMPKIIRHYNPSYCFGECPILYVTDHLRGIVISLSVTECPYLGTVTLPPPPIFAIHEIFYAWIVGISAHLIGRGWIMRDIFTVAHRPILYRSDDSLITTLYDASPLIPAWMSISLMGGKELRPWGHNYLS
jgi:hypothetical protein